VPNVIEILSPGLRSAPLEQFRAPSSSADQNILPIDLKINKQLEDISLDQETYGINTITFLRKIRPHCSNPKPIQINDTIIIKAKKNLC
jgi:hypothetical protein